MYPQLRTDVAKAIGEVALMLPPSIPVTQPPERSHGSGVASFSSRDSRSWNGSTPLNGSPKASPKPRPPAPPKGSPGFAKGSERDELLDEPPEPEPNGSSPNAANGSDDDEAPGPKGSESLTANGSAEVEANGSDASGSPAGPTLNKSDVPPKLSWLPLSSNA